MKQEELNLEVFCYLGLLRFPEQLEPSLLLLQEQQRAQASSLLATIKALPKAELVRRWSKLREDEGAAMRRDAYKRTGIRLDDLAPSLRNGCVSWLLNQHE